MFDLARPAWHRQAACRDEDPTIFFVSLGSRTRQARVICRTCPVKSDCLAEALADKSTKGVRGGTTERQRKRLRARAPGQVRA